jgi:hypothetical protein
MAGSVVGYRPFGAFAGEGARATLLGHTRLITFWWKQSNTFDGCGVGRRGT